MKEPILAVKRANLPSHFKETGVNHAFGLLQDLRQIKGVYLDREDLEEDPTYKQLIPYVVIRKGNKYLTYTRAKGSGETRLLKKKSIGFGGHVDQQGAGHPSSFSSTSVQIAMAAARELKEELDLNYDHSELTPWFTVNNEENAVGKVHLGIVSVVEIKVGEAPRQMEEGVANLEWLTIDELLEEDDKHEEWSQMVIHKLSKAGVLT